MATIRRFEDLEIWQIARKLSLKVFQLTEIGPVVRDFKFKDQIRASAGSVMDNTPKGLNAPASLNL